MITRLKRTFDWRFLAFLTILILTSTLCYGFITRGQNLDRIRANRDSVQQQVSILIGQNARIEQQLEAQRRRSLKAQKDRDAQTRQIQILTALLKANGIAIPGSAPIQPSASQTPKNGPVSPSASTTPTGATTTPRPSSSPAPASPGPTSEPAPSPTSSPTPACGLLCTIGGLL